MADERPCSSDRWRPPRRGLGGRDGRAWRAALRAARPPTPTSSARSCSGRSSTSRATRCSGPLRPPRPCVRRAGLRAVGFDDEPARALFAGISAHSMLRLDRPLSAAFGLVLATYAHAVGWPMVAGGAVAVADALVAELAAAGGEIVTDHRGRPRSPTCPTARASLFDTSHVSSWRSPATGSSARTAAGPNGSATARACSRWTGRSTGRCRGPPTVRAGRPRSISGARSTRSPRPRRTSRPAATRNGRTSCSSSTRRGTRPGRRTGKTTAWAYCHVPAGSDVDMTDRIEAQVERFAPGFRDRILARLDARPGRRWPRTTRTTSAATSTAGIEDIRQLIFRPWPTLDPYRRRRRAVPVLVVDATGRRRARDEGLLAARSALRHELALRARRPGRRRRARGAARPRRPAPRSPARATAP